MDRKGGPHAPGPKSLDHTAPGCCHPINVEFHRARFLFKFDLVFHSGLVRGYGDPGGEGSCGLTAFGSSLRKLFRIHFLSPLFIVPLDYLAVFLCGAFLSSSGRLFYCRAFILSKCFDKFPEN